MNGIIQQCNIWRHDKYNFHLIMCVLQPHISNITEVMNAEEMMGKMGLG